MPGDSYVTVEAMSALVEPNLRSWRMGATMFLAFGALAVLLAAIGLYSVIAYDLSQRKRDLSIRLALGAGRARLMRDVLVRGAVLVLIGLVVSAGGAFWAAPTLESLMFQQAVRDPVVFAGVACGLLLVGLCATLGPALRAGRADAAAVLRAD